MILECPLSLFWLNSSLPIFFFAGSLRAQGSLPADGLAACSHPNGGFDRPDGDFLKCCHGFLQHFSLFRLSDLHHLHCELISLRISFSSLHSLVELIHLPSLNTALLLTVYPLHSTSLFLKMGILSLVKVNNLP